MKQSGVTELSRRSRRSLKYPYNIVVNISMAAVTIVGRIKNKHINMNIGNEMLQQYLDKYVGINIDDKPQHDICNIQ